MIVFAFLAGFVLGIVATLYCLVLWGAYDESLALMDTYGDY